VRVLFVASEAYPLVKTGGLADVCGALPAALTELGLDVRVLLPGYRQVLDGLETSERIAAVEDLFGGEGALVAGRMPNGVPAFAIEARHLYDRFGNIYVGADGRGWSDNHFRFGALSWLAAHLPPEAAWRPDVVHAHDWQAGLAPAYLTLEGGIRPATVITVHNLAFQGLFPADRLTELRLPARAFIPSELEFHGQIGFLKAALVYADRITTVSATYAREICAPAQGAGLDGLLRWRRDELKGVLNGIDTEVWNPRSDAELARTYGPETVAAKAENKLWLQRHFGLAERPERLLFGVISRLTNQKGVDLLLPLIPLIIAAGGQIVLLGTGDRALETAIAAAAARYPGDVGVVLGYDEPLAHRIQGGADALLVPSRFEPCGLTQLAALRYGTVPVVARVGGLADSVVDADPAAIADGSATGIQFSPVTTEALSQAIERAFELFRKPETWRTVQRRGMAEDVGWGRAAAEYNALYSSLVAGRAAPSSIRGLRG
jgi:starch synthase